ncbi:MAG: hypothetical protein AMJ94_18325 [Deltaproteobacteria bacterium SM23_61]|nr:MAG: hypothetical protein AMJ94_18325 [Deltaproteobacteria bacterium SM23_61]
MESREARDEPSSKFKCSKIENQEKTFEFGTFGFVSNFGFRPSSLEWALSRGSFDAILPTT